MDGGAQVKGLQAASTRIAISKLRAHLVEHSLYIANALAHNQLRSVF